MLHTLVVRPQQLHGGAANVWGWGSKYGLGLWALSDVILCNQPHLFHHLLLLIHSPSPSLPGAYGPPPPGRGAPPPPPPFTSYIVSTPPGGFPPPQGFPQGYGTPPPFSKYSWKVWADNATRGLCIAFIPAPALGVMRGREGGKICEVHPQGAFPFSPRPWCSRWESVQPFSFHS